MEHAAAVTRTNYTNETLEQWKQSDRRCFGFPLMIHKYGAGTYVLMFVGRTIVGVARLGQFANGETCRLKTPFDDPIYTGENAQFDAYRVAIERYKLFETPIAIDEIVLMFGFPSLRKNTNLTTGTNHLHITQIYHRSQEDPTLNERVNGTLKRWIETSVLN